MDRRVRIQSKSGRGIGIPGTGSECPPQFSETAFLHLTCCYLLFLAWEATWPGRFRGI